MEYISGNISIKNILLDNGNWWKLFLKHRNLIRPAIISNVLKLLVCKTSFLGYHFFMCPRCGHTLKVPHSCKSRFCSSCGKKATDVWIKTNFDTLPQTTWQHITFTMPSALWDFFWMNRYLMNKIPSIAANIIKQLSEKQSFMPGIFLVLHTFGRDLKKNIHIHLSTTAGGLSLNHSSWTNGFFYHDSIKKMWRYEVLSLLREEFKNGKLKCPPSLKHIKTYSTFLSWTAQFYNTTWVVHLNKQSDNMKHNIDYLGKYLKRPPIGETRIKSYDKQSVTYQYLDHYTKTNASMSLPVLDFISRLISHIPDKNFRVVRYYGFLANRIRSTLLPIVYTLLNLKNNLKTKVKVPWRQLFESSFNIDPLICKFCKTLMLLRHIVFPNQSNILTLHKEIAHEYFKPV
jgi:hypothetical protein